MRHVIHSREELLEIAAKWAPTDAVSRTIRTLGATVYGGRNLALDLPGWLVMVTMKHKTYYVSITIHAMYGDRLISYHDTRPEGYDKLITREIL